MQNLKMYLTFKKDISFKEQNFNELDGLLFSVLSYIKWENIVSEGKDKILLSSAAKIHNDKYRDELTTSSYLFSMELIEVLDLLIHTTRYKDVYLSQYHVIHDGNSLTQFCALYLNVSKNISFISYRGTDNSMLGWKENLRMIYVTELECHQHACDYLGKIMKEEHKLSYLPAYWNFHSIYLGGHSKGGNLAMAAAYKASDYHRVIKQVYSFDGPGFLQSFYDLYENKALASKIVNYVPQGAMIGRFLNHQEKTVIVRSREIGLIQHDIFNWFCETNQFIRAKDFDSESDDVKEYLNTLLFEGDVKVKEETLYKIFNVLDKMSLTNLADLNTIKLSQGYQGVKEVAAMNSEQRKFFIELITYIVKQTKNIILSNYK